MIGRRRDLTFEIVNEEFPELTPSVLDILDGLSAELGLIPWHLDIVNRLMSEYRDLIISGATVGELSRQICLAWKLMDEWSRIDHHDFAEAYDKWKKEIIDKEAPRREAARKLYDTWAFFSRPDAKAKIEFWKNAAVLTASEATALSFGKEPTVVNEASISEFAPPPCGSPFKENFVSRLDLIKRSQLAGELSNNINLMNLRKWAARRGIIFDLNLSSAGDPLQPTPSAAALEEKGLSPKSRNYLYRMILGMAISRYGYITDHNDAATEAITLELQELGSMGIDVELGKDSVSNHLARAAETLGVRTVKAARLLTNLPSLQNPISDS